VVVLAVKLLLGHAQDHPFEQGNKRTAFISAVTFLESNGYELVANDSDQLGVVIEKAITGNVSEELFTEFIGWCVRELPPDE
jgi:death on curing protein